MQARLLHEVNRMRGLIVQAPGARRLSLLALICYRLLSLLALLALLALIHIK